MTDTHDDEIKINYAIKYRFPLITHCLGEAVPVDYDFSTITLRSLIAAIKAGHADKLKNEVNSVSIYFGNSLRLLGVRDIISLMQVCKQQRINLPDIKHIDWAQAFNTISDYQDSRLFKFTFDDEQKPLLISLYLTGYDHDYSILKQFVHDYDVPVNEQDDRGNTIMHHMIDKNDMIGIQELLSTLQPQQKK
eukprot:393511_1